MDEARKVRTYVLTVRRKMHGYTEAQYAIDVYDPVLVDKCHIKCALKSERSSTMSGIQSRLFRYHWILDRSRRHDQERSASTTALD
jgi:hypothetical protein